MRVLRWYALVRTGNATKRGASVVGPTVLVGHRLKARCGRILRRCDRVGAFLEVIRSATDAAACHGVLWGGSTSLCSVVDRRCCLVGVRAYVSLQVYHHGQHHQHREVRLFASHSALLDPSNEYRHLANLPVHP